MRMNKTVVLSSLFFGFAAHAAPPAISEDALMEAIKNTRKPTPKTTGDLHNATPKVRTSTDAARLRQQSQAGQAATQRAVETAASGNAQKLSAEQIRRGRANFQNILLELGMAGRFKVVDKGSLDVLTMAKNNPKGAIKGSKGDLLAVLGETGGGVFQATLNPGSSYNLGANCFLNPNFCRLQVEKMRNDCFKARVASDLPEDGTALAVDPGHDDDGIDAIDENADQVQ